MSLELKKGSFDNLCLADEIPQSPLPSSARFQEFPTEEDWNLLLKRASYVTAERGTVILEEGKTYQRVYQIIKGSVRIEKKLSSDVSPSAASASAPATRGEQGL